MDNLIVNGTDLLLYGTVGDSWDGFTSAQVIEALSTLSGKPVSVRINSFGGYVHEGVAIYNALKNHNAEVTTYVDAMAASAASVIAMAGAKVVMRKGSLLMIHDPWSMTVGNQQDHEASMKMLEVTAESIASIYAAKTGRPVEDIRAEMKEELWLSPADAIAKGYADVEEGEAVEAAAFDYRMFAKAPEPLKALAAAKGWKNQPRSPAASAAQPSKESPMPEILNNPAPSLDAAAAESAVLARVNGIMAVCNAAGEPAMAASLIREGLTVDAARARVEGAREIRAAVARAAKVSPLIDVSMADSYIASGASVEKVRSDLFDRMASAQESRPTNSALPVDGGNGSSGAKSKANLDPFSIYSSRQNARVERGRAKGFLA